MWILSYLFNIFIKFWNLNVENFLNYVLFFIKVKGLFGNRTFDIFFIKILFNLGWKVLLWISEVFLLILVFFNFRESLVVFGFFLRYEFG